MFLENMMSQQASNPLITGENIIYEQQDIKTSASNEHIVLVASGGELTWM